METGEAGRVWRVVMAVVIVLVAQGCTSILPMTGNMNDTLSDDDVKRIAAITHLTEEQVRDPTIHEVHEVTLPCVEMFRECYAGMKWYMIALGFIPLGCTKLIQQPWNEKVAIIYSCWMTDPLTMAHEREHAKGKTHAYW